MVRGLYFIAEIGINHNGDLNIAKKLIDASHATNWDCVKFQKRNPDVCVPDKQKNIIRDTPWGKIPYIEYKHKVEFGKDEYDEISKYCRDKNIDWTVSVWDIDSVDFIKNYDVPFIKIPSAMLTNHELIESTINLNKHIILSTGMSTLDEIDKAVDVMKGNCEYTLLHCNSTYPAKDDELNLRVINTLQKRYDCPIGYSGHERDLEAPLIAITLGARIIERHVTLSHEMWGTDHQSSLEVHAMDMLKKRADKVLPMLGSEIKTITDGEISVREKLRG